MSRTLELGRVSCWRYVVVCRGDGFEVLRQDIAFDQIEERLANRGNTQRREQKSSSCNGCRNTKKK
jgi:hypothetical protein